MRNFFLSEILSLSAPETKKIFYEDLSPYSRFLLDGGSKNYQSEKLISHLGPRERYVCHGENLQFYVREGMRVSKIHRILCFKQSAFLAPFVRKCTGKLSPGSNYCGGPLMME